MRLAKLAISVISLAGFSVASGCSSGGVAVVNHEEDAYSAGYMEWPGYYDPDYPYYYTLHDRDRDGHFRHEARDHDEHREMRGGHEGHAEQHEGHGK